jgi:hypothetical protein
METLLLILIGCFIGWHFPQPTWAQFIETWVRTKIGK